MSWPPFFTTDAVPVVAEICTCLWTQPQLCPRIGPPVDLQPQGDYSSERPWYRGAFLAWLSDEGNCILLTGLGPVHVCSNVLRFIGERVSSLPVDEFRVRQRLCFVQCPDSVALAASYQSFCGYVFVDTEYRLFLDSEYTGCSGNRHQPWSGNQSQFGHKSRGSHYFQHRCFECRHLE